MKLLAFVNSGFEEISKQEIKELTNFSAIVYSQVLEFFAENLNSLFYLQSIRRLALSLGKFKTIEEINFEGINLFDFFASELSFKVEVENVEGQENRQDIAKKVVGKLYVELEKVNLNPQVDVRNPDFILLIYFNGENYFLGVDLAGKELNARDYRIFPHSASFKGDLAYFFVRKSGFKPGHKLLVGFAKDGAIAIEAALYESKLPVQKGKNFSLFKFPLFKDFVVPESTISGSNVFTFDETQQNYTAARRNVKLAGVNVTVNKFSLDEMDVKFTKGEFDNLMLQVTKKDEEKLNEIYYQTNYVLKKGGMLMFVGRKGWEFTISDKFKLVEEGEVEKGDSVYKFWLLESK